jgi:uncharacterized protein (DUF2147 family)
MASNITARFPLLRPAVLTGLLTVSTPCGAAQVPATAPPEVGTWIDATGAGAVEIYICADRADRLCGRIVWLKELLNAQGVPKRDRYNPNAALQNRPICGLPVLGNLARVSGGFDGGWIYDPKVGKSYNAAVQLATPDRLVVTGYMSLKFLSKSFTWSRAPADLQRCPTAPPAVPSKPQEIKASPPAQSDTKSVKASTGSSAPAKAAADVAIVPPPPKPAVAPKKKDLSESDVSNHWNATWPD